jgi:hypothetical protein
MVGVDQMASANITNPALVSTPVVTAGGQLPLRHLVLLGLAEGRSLEAFRTMSQEKKSTTRTTKKKLHLEPAILA